MTALDRVTLEAAAKTATDRIVLGLEELGSLKRDSIYAIIVGAFRSLPASGGASGVGERKLSKDEGHRVRTALLNSSKHEYDIAPGAGAAPVQGELARAADLLVAIASYGDTFNFRSRHSEIVRAAQACRAAHLLLAPAPVCVPAGEVPEDRCDYCDNGIEKEWLYCAFCGDPIGVEGNTAAPSPASDGVREALEKVAKAETVGELFVARNEIRAALQAKDA